MTNDNIFQFLYSLIQQVLQLASDFKIYQGPSYSVSILQFFLALSIMAIVLRSLINFVSSTFLFSSTELSRDDLSVKNRRDNIAFKRNLRRVDKEMKK